MAPRESVQAAHAFLQDATDLKHVTDEKERGSTVSKERDRIDGITGTKSPSDRSRVTEPILMDTAELAAMLNMSESWVYREAARLGLKGYKLGRGRNAKVQYKRSDVFRWLEQQKMH